MSQSSPAGDEGKKSVSQKPIVAIAGKIILGLTVLGGLIGTLMQYREFRKEMKAEKDAEVQEYKEQVDKDYAQRLESGEREHALRLQSREMDFKTSMANQKLALAEANTRVNEARAQISRETLERAERRLERAERDRSSALEEVGKYTALAKKAGKKKKAQEGDG